MIWFNLYPWLNLKSNSEIILEVIMQRKNDVIVFIRRLSEKL